MPTDIVGLWWLTLALAVVVILVVAVLLVAIVRTFLAHVRRYRALPR